MSSVEISYQEFQKLDLRIGTVVTVERLPRTEKLYKIIVDLGSLGTRQTVAGLAPYYSAEELKGKKVVFLANLKPARFSGESSQGMLLAAEDAGKVSLLSLDRNVSNGSKIR
jgi:methionine--tRNA ligase beta chain